jgi:hypothetical protein
MFATRIALGKLALGKLTPPLPLPRPALAFYPGLSVAAAQQSLGSGQITGAFQDFGTGQITNPLQGITSTTGII